MNRAVTAGLRHSHRNARFKPHLKLLHSLWQCQILDILSKARDRTHVLMDTTSQVLNLLNTRETLLCLNLRQTLKIKQFKQESNVPDSELFVYFSVRGRHCKLKQKDNVILFYYLEIIIYDDNNFSFIKDTLMKYFYHPLQITQKSSSLVNKSKEEKYLCVCFCKKFLPLRPILVWKFHGLLKCYLSTRSDQPVPLQHIYISNSAGVQLQQPGSALSEGEGQSR